MLVFYFSRTMKRLEAIKAITDTYICVIRGWICIVIIFVHKCCNCKNSECFTIESGYNICDYCGVANGHVLGFYDVKDYDRLHFRKKSIYQRKYHYEKKVNQVFKRLNLTEDEKCELYNKLMAIDNNVMEILNKKYCRKRMISIFYLIKKLLEEGS